VAKVLFQVPLVALPQEREEAVVVSHLRLVPPLEQEALPLEQEAPQPEQVVLLLRALVEELPTVHYLALDLERQLQLGLEQGLQLPQEMVEDLVMARVEAQDLASALARVATLGLILEQE
jgi:hypothetical protein